MPAPATLTWIAADGSELELTGDIVVRDGPVGLDSPPPALTTADGYSDGKTLTNARHDGRTVALPLAVLTDGTDLRTIKATLTSKMNVRRGAGQLRYEGGDRRRTLRQVIYQGGLEGDETQTRDDWALFVVSLLALDPFWYEPEQSIVLSSPDVPAEWDASIPWSSPYPWNGPGVGISSGLEWNEALPWNSALPWDGGAVVTPPLDGDADVWPRFTFLGPATGFSVVHLGTGERIALADGFTLGEGQSVVVDTQPGAARGVSSGGLPAWNMLTVDSTADLPLAVGDMLAVTMTGTGVNSYVRIAWSNRWLTPYSGALTSAFDEPVMVDGGSP